MVNGQNQPISSSQPGIQNNAIPNSQLNRFPSQPQQQQHPSTMPAGFGNQRPTYQPGQPSYPGKAPNPGNIPGVPPFSSGQTAGNTSALPPSQTPGQYGMMNSNPPHQGAVSQNPFDDQESGMPGPPTGICSSVFLSFQMNLGKKFKWVL